MDPHEIHKLLKAMPFVPFAVHLDDGRQFDVRERGDAMVTGILLYLGTEYDEKLGMFADSVIVSPSRVSRLEAMLS